MTHFIYCCAEGHYAEWRYAKCLYAECRDTQKAIESVNQLLPPQSIKYLKVRRGAYATF
jgi:hypothetical protein